jgi:hypothetical protein
MGGFSCIVFSFCAMFRCLPHQDSPLQAVNLGPPQCNRSGRKIQALRVRGFAERSRAGIKATYLLFFAAIKHRRLLCHHRMGKFKHRRLLCHHRTGKFKHRRLLCHHRKRRFFHRRF